MTSLDDGNKAVLITGVAGFIGSHLAESLLRQGIPVVGLDSFDPFYPRACKERNLVDIRNTAAETGTPFHFHEIDLRLLGVETLSARPLQAIVHLAAKAGVSPSLADAEGYSLTNVQGTVHLLELARRAGVPRFVFASSSSVYGESAETPFREDLPAQDPISPYAASKRAGELYCSAYAHLYGMRIASLRLFTVIGPRQRPDLAIHHFVRAISRQEPITLFAEGKSERDYTFVSDITDGIRAALQWTSGISPGTHSIFNLGGAHPTPLRELVRLIEHALGMKAITRLAPARAGDVSRTFASIEKAQRVLGYTPKVSTADGVRAFVEWYRRLQALDEAA